MQGVLYTATGPEYVEQAIVSITSLRRWNNHLGVAVFTDDPDAFEGLADFITPITYDPPNRDQRMLPRLKCLLETPFERTLALDTDTIVLGSITDLFSVLDHVGVGVCHGHQRGRRHSAALRAGKAKPEIPYAFAPVQGGVILYDETAGRQFVTDVVALYQKKQYIDDQVSMREVLWDADYRFTFLGPEYNVWQLETLDQWDLGGFDQAWPKIFHTVTLKQYLSPQQIDGLLLPIATRSMAAQRNALSREEGESAASGKQTVIQNFRSRIRQWLSRWCLRRRAASAGRAGHAEESLRGVKSTSTARAILRR